MYGTKHRLPESPVILERELEQLMEKEEADNVAQEVPTCPQLKRSRQSAISNQQAVVPHPSPAIPSSASSQRYSRPPIIDELTTKIKVSHVAACRREDELLDRKKRCVEEVQKLQGLVSEAEDNVKTAQTALRKAEGCVRSAQGSLGWLTDAVASFEKAQGKQLFSGPVLSSVALAIERLHEALDHQRRQKDEADQSLSKSKVSIEECSNHHLAARKRLEQARLALSKNERDVLEAQREVHRLEQQAAWNQTASQKVLELGVSAAQLEQQCSAAVQKRNSAQLQLSKFQSWVEDLQRFFEGHEVQDAGAIYRGLQAVLPTNDPLPVMVRALLLDTRSFDRSNPTVLSTQRLVMEPLKAAEEDLKAQLVSHQSKLAESQKISAEALIQLRRHEEQLQAMASSLSSPAASKRPENVATPMKTLEMRQSGPRSLQTANCSRHHAGSSFETGPSISSSSTFGLLRQNV